MVSPRKEGPAADIARGHRMNFLHGATVCRQYSSGMFSSRLAVHELVPGLSLAIPSTRAMTTAPRFRPELSARRRAAVGTAALPMFGKKISATIVITVGGLN